VYMLCGVKPTVLKNSSDFHNAKDRKITIR